MDEIELEQLIEKCSAALGRNVRYENINYAVRDLLNIIDRQQQEYITISQSIGEDDAIIEQLQEEIKQYQLQETLLLERLKKQDSQTSELEEHNRKLRKRIFELKIQTGYQVHKENLALAQELALLKGEISG